MSVSLESVSNCRVPLLSRDQMRLDRQARTGIQRNPHEPQRLLPRAAVLTGRWVDLRSRRRLGRDVLEAGFPRQVETNDRIHWPHDPFVSGVIVAVDRDPDPGADLEERMLRCLRARLEAGAAFAEDTDDASMIAGMTSEPRMPMGTATFFAADPPPLNVTGRVVVAFLAGLGVVSLCALAILRVLVALT